MSGRPLIAAVSIIFIMLIGWQPATATPHHDESSKQCVKYEFADGYGPTWVADRDYSQVRIKAGRNVHIWDDVHAGDRLTVPPTPPNDKPKDISHVVTCWESGTPKTEPTTVPTTVPKPPPTTVPPTTVPTTTVPPTTTPTPETTTPTPPPTSTPTVPTVPTPTPTPPTTIGSPTTSPPTSPPPPTVDTPVTTDVVEESAPPPSDRERLPDTGLSAETVAAIGIGLLVAGLAGTAIARRVDKARG